MQCVLLVGLLCGVALAQPTSQDGPLPHPDMPVDMPPMSESERPLVRCKRPMMCKMLCPYGFTTDIQGCPLCECQKNPCESKKCDEGKVCRPTSCGGHPCLEMQVECQEPVYPCPMPMCANDCERGYAVNSRGCQTCKCKGPEPIKQCPLAMCAMFCEFGFMQDENGCDMCGCRKTPKALKEETCKCPTGQSCRFPDNKCTPITTCESLRHVVSHPELVDQRLTHVTGFQALMKKFQTPPTCTEDGSFHPRQCGRPGGECFCVNDRGQETSKSRWQDREDSQDSDWERHGDHSKPRHREGSHSEHKHGSHDRDEKKMKEPMCDLQRTVMMKIAFNLMHELQEDMEQHIGKIRELMHDHIGHWMGVKQETITIITITPHETLVKVLRVTVTVEYDGHTDLPSAYHRLQAAAHEGASIPYKHSLLKVQPDSLHADHLSDAQVHGEPGRVTSCFGYVKHWAHHHRVMVIIAPIIGLILLAIIAGICTAICKRRRSARAQFSHKRLENMETFKKNMQLEFDHPDMKSEKPMSVTIISAEEKQPMA